MMLFVYMMPKEILEGVWSGFYIFENVFHDFMNAIFLRVGYMMPSEIHEDVWSGFRIFEDVLDNLKNATFLRDKLWIVGFCLVQK